MSRPANRENLMSLADQLVWGMQTYGVSTELFGATAYVGFNLALDPKDNYWYCDGTADDVQINAAEAYVTALGGGSVVLERGTYVLADPIIPTGNQVCYCGQGPDTLIDGDGLATTEHAFHITGRDEITITNMSIQTQDGGTKTCHCIFIEDGSDDFHITHVTFVESDDNCIHIEGTTINQGHIHGCHFVGADGNGIYVNMDGANAINRLHIIDNDIIAMGGAGIYFDAAGGNNYCVIEGNVIASAAGIGIYLDDGAEVQITGNLCVLGGLSGIHVVGSTEVNITDNMCLSNERHGIFLTGVTTNCLVDGNICNDNDDHDSNTYDGINIDTGSIGNRIINNSCLRNHNYGIYNRGAGNQINNNTVGVNDREGIITNVADCQINGNYVYDNGQDAAGTYHGIYIVNPGDSPTIIGNTIDGYGDSQEDGIHLADGVTNALISGNYCLDGMGSGIALTANNVSCAIVGNYLMNNDDYGVEITAASCTNNLVKENYFVGNVTGAFLDSGVQTELAILTLPFIAGGDIDGTAVWASYVSATASAKGWSVSGAADWAQALGQLPQELKQIVRVKIWAVALGAPIGGGGQMHLEINMNAGAENLAYTTEAVALANFDGETTDYVANDVVLWVVDSSDDSDIGDMAPGMSLAVEVIYEDGSDPDGATNAVFRIVEVEYV